MASASPSATEGAPSPDGPAADGPAADAWAWAVRLYGAPGVREACLALQDGAGVDVVLLLELCRRGMSGGTLDEGTASRLRSAAAAWRLAIVAPLRQARRALRGNAAPSGFSPVAVARLRHRIAAAELEAEQLQVEMLAAVQGSSESNEPLAPEAAIRRSLPLVGITVPTPLEPELARVVGAALTLIAHGAREG